MSDEDQRYTRMGGPHVRPSGGTGANEETLALVRQLHQRKLRPTPDAPADVRATADRGTGSSPTDEGSETRILIDEEELQRRLARPEQASSRPRRSPHRSPAVEPPDARGLPEKPHPLPPVVPSAAPPRPSVSKTPDTGKELKRGTTSQQRGLSVSRHRVQMRPPTGEELAAAAEEIGERFGDVPPRKTRRGPQTAWRERFYWNVLRMDPDELSISRRLEEIGPLVELLVPLIQGTTGSRRVEEKTQVGIGVVFALIEEVARIIDTVVALIFLLVQEEARLGLAMEEIMRARNRLEVLRDYLLALAIELGSVPLRLTAGQVLGIEEALRYLSHQIDEFGAALRDRQPFRYGRAGGHLATAIVGMVRFLGSIRGQVGPTRVPTAPLGLRGWGVDSVHFIEVMKQAKARLRRGGVRGLPPAQYGTRLHSEVSNLIRQGQARFPPGWWVESERTFTQLAGRLRISRKTLDLTVEEFVDQAVRRGRMTADAGERVKGQLGSQLLRRRVGNLKPDAVASDGAGNFLVEDLTSAQRAEHLAKTDLYAAIVTEGQAVDSVSMGEFYW